MPYRDVAFVKGEYYHVFNRGNRKEDIFRDDQDKRIFLRRVKEYKDEFFIVVLAYCLMPNHFHLILRQGGGGSISKFLQKALLSYSVYFNKKYDIVGRLFQGPFKAKHIAEESYLLQLSRYIHLNPIELMSYNQTRSLARYLWSSYPEYLGIIKNGICEKEMILGYFSKTNPNLSYKNFVEQSDIEDLRERLGNLALD